MSERKYKTTPLQAVRSSRLSLSAFPARRGQSLIEVLVAVGVGAILVMAAAAIIAPALQSNRNVEQIQVATALQRELLDNVRVFAEADWHNVASLATSSANIYHLNATSSPFAAISGSESLAVGTTTYQRYFYLEETMRDGAGNISGGGTINDPSTRRLTVVAGWTGGATSSLATYLTRSANRVYSQTDWSGGPGHETASSTVGIRFATSTNLDFASVPGSVYISGIDTEGPGYDMVPQSWAWSENIGWIDFYNVARVQVTDARMKGYASSSVGSIALDCATSPEGDVCAQSDFRVSNDGEGVLSGWAWNNEIGWLSFSCTNTDTCGTSDYGVTIDQNGDFHGWAWSENIGWLSFNCANTDTCGESDYKVSTEWRP